MVKPLRSVDPVMIGPYRLLGRLGAGGMGRVYLATSRSGRRVALKVVDEELAEDPDFRRRFAREVDAARSVSALFTASVVDADTDSARLWAATTYIDGPTLTYRVLEGGAFTVAQALTLAAGLAEALSGIHAAGLIHRDLKPGNVMLTDGGPQVIDFGIALRLDGTRLTRSVVLGTPSYMAPERLLGEQERAAGDVFAFGACLVFACTGHGIVRDDVTGAQIGQILMNRLDLSGVPGSLRPFVQLCLARDPKARPTAPELLDILLASRAPRPEPGWYLPTREPEVEHHISLPRRRLKRRDLLAYGAVGAAALGAATWSVLRREDEPPVGTAPVTPSSSGHEDAYTWEVEREYRFPLTSPQWMETRAFQGRPVVLAADDRRIVGWDPGRPEPLIDIEAEPPGSFEPMGFVPGIVKVGGKWAALLGNTARERYFAIDVSTGELLGEVHASPSGTLPRTVALAFQDGQRPVAYGMWATDPAPDAPFTIGCWRTDTGARLASAVDEVPGVAFRDGGFPIASVAGEVVPPGDEAGPPILLTSIRVAEMNYGISVARALGQDVATTIVLPAEAVPQVIVPPDPQRSGRGGPLTVMATNGLSAWDLGTRQLAAGPFTPPSGGLLPMLAACGLPGPAVVAATSAVRLLLWDPDTGAQLGETHTAHNGTVLGLATIGRGPDQQPISAGSDGRLKLWRIRRP